MVKLAVVIMMKNEAKIIQRCLSGIKNLADKVILLDTGSTDDTVYRAAVYLQDEKIPFRLYNEKFVDFAYCRSRLLELARCESDMDYALMVDCDEMVNLEVSPEIFKNALVKEIYDVNMHADIMSYPLPRLTSNKIEVNYVGVTHEFLDSKQYGRMMCPYLRIIQVNDSFRRVNNLKHKEDIELLENAIKNANGDEALIRRHTFYLAQSYLNDNQLEKAHIHYKRRTEQGGWNEEIYYSYYMMGGISHRLGRNEAMWLECWQAHNVLPTRLEAIALLKRYCDSNNMRNISEKVLLPIFKATQHPKQGLFLEDYLYFAYK